MEIRWDKTRVVYADVLGQICRKGKRKPCGRDIGFQTVAPPPGNRRAEFARVNPAVRPAASHNVAGISEEPFRREIQPRLHRVRIRLNLISAVTGADISDSE